MADILALLFPFFGLIVIGFGAAKIFRHPEEGTAWLNIFIIYAALPALFFKLVSRTPFEQLTRLDFVSIDVAATYSVFLLLFAIGYFWKKNGVRETTIQSFAGSYGNIGYMGPGLALLALGEEAAVPVALIICFENALHFIVAPTVMATAGGGGGRSLVRHILLRALLHPFLVATALGFAVSASGFAVPQAFNRLVDYLAQAAAPCALFAMGVTLALRPVRRVPTEINYIVPAKLILHPLVVYLFMMAHGGFDPLWVKAAVLMAALPTATNVFVIARQYGIWYERASATILISTVASVATLGVLLALISANAIPF
ncbi:AEC family transporter [Martelella mediterranea]|uniref:Putative transporter YfdV n=1 Tax=Martelella mediterranea DSM 17316 TaxID=1122214 RepID=A0A1U9Z484_9HYPH|nr:AEC family transporter [Martelella mediterranea]AQZ52440.1 putative transporter YfdV [Martelella mediterranea DSM 17316]